ncbi:sucrase ferredoxin [Rhodococcus sp. 27YEA15]|uniref:sucrase ferredoxin n=1 Tax=Rhodococcus sp. 27YEA15 TaxID=3156259 RepID=UPI003C7CFF2B
MTCSTLSAVDEPLAGTAATIRRWVCLEFDGGWGRDVLDGTALEADLAAELRRRAEQADVRIMFIRRPGRSMNRVPGHTVLLARSEPGETWCEQLHLDAPQGLLDLDFTVLAGPAPGLGVRVEDSVVLVCAHGKRDRCCAVLGRPVAAELATAFGDRVWECSHTGGHRFAPSIIVLPTGHTYGRLDSVQSIEAVRSLDSGEVYRTGLRGRSCWSSSAQVSDIAVRELISARVEDLSVVDHADGQCTVEHLDGRNWTVETAVAELESRPPSCGAAIKPVRPVVATSVRENPPRRSGVAQ